ncbi:hypothetical protein CDD82_2061 [Ophiocordyceps australis]|uniref:Uncharacterized protein n=1 Tax=Ophiocordyceps australis TaxID=1399860 RepID=A0A2C5YPE8_9HYPO|nr:hypothetical protein CDD82_2061 [Ophiocordyceps australis]
MPRSNQSSRLFSRNTLDATKNYIQTHITHMDAPRIREARSLASLNVLAANPPQYPEKPQQDKQEPLVLYISRVPGTRDVILSPFKPQVKNVTGGDVSTCLYYLHLELPASQQATTRTDNLSRSSQESSRLAIPRKPLPDSARPLTPDSIPSPSNAQPSLPSDSNTAWTQQPDPSLASNAFSRQGDIEVTHSGLVEAAPQHVRAPSGLSTTMPKRKPVAPPRIVTQIPSPGSGKTLPPVPGQESVSAPTPDSHAGNKAPCPSSPTRPMRRQSASGTPFALTLIRRDPGSGNQWNVGRVKSRQLDAAPAMDVSGDGSCPAVTSWSSPPPIDAEIETSGYAKFRRPPPQKSDQGGLEAAISSALAQDSPSNDAGVFTRRAVMACTKSWTATLKDKLRRLEQAGRERINQSRDNSIMSADSTAATEPSIEVPRLKPRGYTFTSPWHTKCEFRTGNGGRSVQCRHLHAEGSDVYNPLVADRTGSSLWSGYSTIVSDLRFNLPTSEVLGEHARNTRDEWRGNFNKLLKPAARDERDAGVATAQDADEEEGVSPFEVNVGLERAGGGPRGSRAKLGKLVIYPEGLKMLDLVVAMNMGVWWGAWEKTF